MDGIWRDLRLAARGLRRRPGLTAIVIVALALGSGVNVAIFSVLDQVLFRRLAVAEAGRLTVLHATITSPGLSSSDSGESVFSYPMYRDLLERNQVFDRLVARAGVPASLADGLRTEPVSAELVSGNYFEALGVRAVLGRTLQTEDEITPGGHPVLVLGHDAWRLKFGGDPAVLDRKVLVNGHPMTIVGVAAEGFRGLVAGQTPDIYVSVAMKRVMTPTWDRLEDRWAHWLNLFGRLRPGLSRAQAEPLLNAAYVPVLADHWAATGYGTDSRSAREYLDHRVQLLSAAQGINQLAVRWESALLILAGMAAIVLLIACANVACLLIVRAADRGREVAVQRALGAGAVAVARPILAESLLLALGGGAAGVLIASWMTPALLHLLPEGALGGWVDFTPDGRLLALATLLSLAACLLSGSLPAWQAGRVNILSALHGQGTGALRAAGSTRLRRGMVVGQMALSVALLGVACLFGRSLFNLSRFDPGFRTESVLTFGVDPRLQGHSFERSLELSDRLRERIAALPGVEAVGAAGLGLLTDSHDSGNITVEGYEASPDENMDCQFNSVAPGTFAALGIPLLAGRDFTEGDRAGAPGVVIVNETFAKYFFGSGSAVGRRIMMGASNQPRFDLEIVGVVRDSRHGSLREPIERFVHVPIAQDRNLKGMTFYARTGSDTAALTADVRRLVAGLDPTLPVLSPRTLRAQVDESIALDRTIATLSTGFGLLAALLAGLGVYGVVALTVARRTPEIGLRVALGARRPQVAWIVGRDLLRLTGAGVGLGLAMSVALGGLVESQLFGIGGRDGLALGGAAVLMVLTAAAAASLPVHRATRVDPMEVLRCE